MLLFSLSTYLPKCMNTQQPSCPSVKALCTWCNAVWIGLAASWIGRRDASFTQPALRCCHLHTCGLVYHIKCPCRHHVALFMPCSWLEGPLFCNSLGSQLFPKAGIVDRVFHSPAPPLLQDFPILLVTWCSIVGFLPFLRLSVRKLPFTVMDDFCCQWVWHFFTGEHCIYAFYL